MNVLETIANDLGDELFGLFKYPSIEEPNLTVSIPALKAMVVLCQSRELPNHFHSTTAILMCAVLHLFSQLQIASR